MITKPLIHKFQNLNNSFYIYDVYTNQFLRVNEIVYNIIDEMTTLRHEEIIRKWRHKYCENDINVAIGQIELHSKKGFFSLSRFKKMVLPYTTIDELNHRLFNKLGWLTLNITNNCNMRCAYCAYSGTYFYQRSHSNKKMSKRIIKDVIDYYIKHSKNSEIKSVSLYGGEPLTAFDLVCFVKECLTALNPLTEYEIRLDTNGLLLDNHNVLDFIIKNNCFLQVSFDGPISVHDKFRIDIKGQSTYNRIMNNLENIHNKCLAFYKKNVTFAVTIAPTLKLIEIDDFFCNNQLFENQNLIVSTVNNQDTTFFQRFNEAYIFDFRKQIIELRNKYINARVHNEEPTSLQKGFFEKGLFLIHRRAINEPYDDIGMNGCCTPGLRRFFVNVNGDFELCEKIGAGLKYGCASKGIDISVINEICQTYIDLSESDCLECWGAKLCASCFLDASKGDHFDIVKKRERCKEKLINLENRFILYTTILEKNPHAFDFVKNVIIS